MLYCITLLCSNSNCGWKIEVSQGYVVRLYVARIDLEESDDCGFDSITVFDGGKFFSVHQHITYVSASHCVGGGGGGVLSEGGGPEMPAREKGLDGSVFSGSANKRTNCMGSRHFEHNAYLLASASSLNNSAPRRGHVKTHTPTIAFRHLPPNSARLLTPLKGHSLSLRSCPATRSAPSERFGY